MPKALDPKATFEYVLERDRDLPDDSPWKTVWLLRGLTINEEAEVANRLFGGQMGTTELRVQTGSYQIAMLYAGLAGWHNFNREDADGTPVPILFEKTRSTNGHVKDELLDLIDGAARTELARAIDQRGKVTTEEGN